MTKKEVPDDLYMKSVEVDFNDPRIQELMRKTEALSLDRRGQQSLQNVLVRPTWNPAEAGVAAVQIGEEAEGQVTLAASQSFAVGDDLLLHRQAGGPGGVYRVEASRPGRRQEDAAQSLFITHLRRRG